MIAVDFESLYGELEPAEVTLDLTEDTHFTYLREKLASVMAASHRVTGLMTRLLRLKDRLLQEEMEQKMLFRGTGMREHKEAAEQAKLQLDRLNTLLSIVKLKKERLRDLPYDIKLYASMLEQGLKESRPVPEGTGGKVVAVPSALSVLAPSHPVADHESLDELFG